MTHTLGSWHIDGDRGVIHGTDGEICQLLHDFHGDDHEFDRGADDACLIAAAPELLTQAKRELAWLEHIMPQVTAPQSVMLGFQQAIKAWRAVIAQAEGIAS